MTHFDEHELFTESYRTFLPNDLENDIDIFTDKI